MSPSIYDRILNDVTSSAFDPGNNAPYQMNRVTTAQRKDALSQMQVHISSLKEVYNVTEMLIKASRQRIGDLSVQREGANNELLEAQLHIQVPMKRELSLDDMMNFYKKQFFPSSEDSAREKALGRVEELSNVVSNIDIELKRAKEEESALKLSLKKLQTDIGAMEQSLEEERSEKVTVMAKYQQERQEILKKQEVETRSSASKVATLQKKLNQAQALTEEIVKKNDAKGYENKIAELQNELRSMVSKISKTKTELTTKLTDSQAALNAALSMNKESNVKLSSYEKKLLMSENKLLTLNKETTNKMKEEKAKEAKYNDTIEKLRKEITNKDLMVNKLEKNLLVESFNSESLKKGIVAKDVIIDSSAAKITSLEKEIRSLQAEMQRKEREAEKKLSDLKVEMVKKITEAEVMASSQLKASKEKLESLKRDHEKASTKKDRMIASLKDEGDHIQRVQEENERMFNTRLDMMKEQMAIKLKEAEAAATNALEAATRQLHTVRSEREKSLSEKDNIISYLEGRRDNDTFSSDESTVSTNSSLKTHGSLFSSKSSRSKKLKNIVSRVTQKLSSPE
mmetsp:Transcript_3197/g.6622  ORF Transcript_3197/g.6622 Transcript_3197/m.6622 type:complete len:570 (+) Transcript_3197:198-1907(+)